MESNKNKNTIYEMIYMVLLHFFFILIFSNSTWKIYKEKQTLKLGTNRVVYHKRDKAKLISEYEVNYCL